MLKYRGRHLIRAGVVGATLIVLVILVGLSPERITSWATSVRYQAVFNEAAGLDVDNDVTLSGMKIGSVRSIALQRGKAVVTFSIAGSVRLGSDTTAHIRTGSLLGKRVLTLESAGTGSMRPLTVIPITRTSAPYSLTDSMNDLTTNIAGTDTKSLNASLDTLSETLDQISPELGPTFDGLTRLSRAINDRNEQLGELLKSAGDVTGILSERSQQINQLILNANDLVGVFNDRRKAIVEMLANISAVSKQLSGLVHDNEKQLAPALQRLNSVTAMLEKNRDNLEKTLPGLAKYMRTQGEVVSSGANYYAFVPNISMPEMIQPFLDYAFGFRRGVDAGQPPDNAGPRAEFPLPYNAIPQHN